MRLCALCVALVVGGIVLVAPASAANLLLNPGFELGTDTDADNWTQVTTGNLANTNPRVERTDESPWSGDFAMRLSYSNIASPGGGSTAVVRQDTAPGSIIPGESYDFSFYARREGAFGGGTVANFQVVFLDSVGGTLPSPGSTSMSVSGDYSFFGVTDLVAPAEGHSARVFIRLTGGAVGNASAIMFVDDVNLTAVPEPAALSLLGLGALGLLRRRRC